MTITKLFRQLRPYVKPYRILVIATLLLTVIGSFAAQVNAWILRYTVDHLTILLQEKKVLADGISLLVTISVVLLTKEIINTIVQFGQKFYGEKLRIYVARDLSEDVVEKEVYKLKGTYAKIFDAMVDSLNIDKIAKTMQ